MHVDLEVEMASDADRVAGLPHGADALACEDALASPDQRRPGHVGVEVASCLAFAVDQQVVAVEDRVVAGPQDLAAADRHQRRATGGDDVEAFVPAAAAAGCAELADVAARAVGAPDGEDVVVVGTAAVSGGAPSMSRRGKQRQR